MSAAAGAIDGTPLVVDVDGTLVQGDLLHEAALQLVARHPGEGWRLVTQLARGKAALKRWLAERVEADPKLPLRAETVAAIRAAQETGRPVYLASASDHRWVEAVAAQVGGVAGVFASDGRTNLAGTAKAEALVDRFGEGAFDYVGDQPVDAPVWTVARHRLLVSHSDAFERKIRRRFPDLTTLARPRPTLRAHLRALRVYQWAKNALVFLPLFAAHSFTDVGALVSATLAFFAFSLAASSAYVVNDLLDLPGDRDHPRKRLRPFASGQLSAVRGALMTVVLATGALVLASKLPPRFLAVLLGYFVLTLSYSLVLKRRLLVDVVTLGGLYTLRVFGGVAAANQSQSNWLLMFSLFLFLSLAAVKRCSELVARREANASDPPGRAYRFSDLGVLFPLAASSGYAAVLVTALYLASPEVAALYRHPIRMWLICPVLLYWISRVLVLSSRNLLHDDPVIFALTDKVSWFSGFILVAIVAASI